MSLALPEDPNIRSNRILNSDEVAWLKGQRARRRQKLCDVDRELVEMKEQYEKYHADYQRKCRELETLASLLNMCRGSIERLEQDRSGHAREDERLSGILHPIKRCPEDILRHIFEWVVLMCNATEELLYWKAPSRLSHVCQHWRSVALDMPSLWTYIYATASGDNMDYLKRLFNAARKRLKSTPAWIGLHIMPAIKGSKSFNKLAQACEISQFMSIEVLALECNSEDIALVSKNFHAQTLKNLSLFQDFDQPIGTSHIDYACLLRSFPAIEDIKLSGMRAVSFQGTGQTKSVRVLTLNRVTMSTQGLGIATFVGLRELTISEIEGVWVEDITLPVVNNVTIDRVDDSCWNRLTTPHVTEVEASAESSNGVVGYLCRHSSIQNIDLGISSGLDDADITRLALAIPDLKSLKIRGQGGTDIISCLTNWEQIGLSNIPFSKLNQLDITGPDIPAQGAPFPWDALQRLVQNRCLPNNRDTRVSGLTLKIQCSQAQIDNTPWHGSSILEQGLVSERKLSNEEVSLSFKWPR